MFTDEYSPILSDSRKETDDPDSGSYMCPDLLTVPAQGHGRHDMPGTVAPRLL